MATETSTSLPRVTQASPEPSTPSILAVVVTHDGRTWLKDCLVALANQSYEMLNVLVVDDASSNPKEEPPLKRMAKRHLRRRRWGYLRTPRSLGYGAAINWALSRVRTDADLLLFLHDDVALTPNSVAHMVERMTGDGKIAVVGPKIVSWEDPTVLEEVGMAVDRFGYPYKGLEDDEIDLGQHDRASEVFYVTSTCMLMRHDVFRSLRGWDARLGAYAEDLDLCWRARVCGHVVRFEPQAVARHAIAMATGQRSTRFSPPRYYIRRNRLRTIAKNASLLRLTLLLPQFVLLTFAEMLAFLVLRQPREVGGLLRALLWNLLSAPQTITERARVQRARRVPDRTLVPLTVREWTRARVYISQQRDRLEEAWGRRAEVVSERTSQARALTRRVSVLQVTAVLLLLVGLALGFRHFVWSPAANVGELLPYPPRATAMWRAWSSPWQAAGLGYEGPAPPAFFLLGFFQIVTLGAAGAAQKLLIVVLGLTAAVGAHRLVGDVVDRAGRITASLVYMLGAVGYAGMRAGLLSVLVFGAAAPFALHSMLRFSGWARPPRWSAGREAARLGLFAAISAAFVPGSLLLYGLAALLLSATRAVLGGRPVVELKRLAGSLASLALAWVLLLPWSATWFSAGGPFDLLRGPTTSDTFVATFSDNGMVGTLLGQMPQGPVLFGLALPLFGLIAVVTGTGQRRRVALALWAVIVGVGLIATSTASGAMAPLVATPEALGVMAAVAWAALCGLAVGAFRLDLPRRRFGVLHAVTLAGLAAGGFLLVAGSAPAMGSGAWGPGRGARVADAEVTSEVGSLLAAGAAEGGEFRALWIGDSWLPPEPSLGRPPLDYLVTDSRGQVLTNLFERRVSDGVRQLQEVVASVASGSTDRGGKLLGAFNVRYVVLARNEGASEWLQQRDLALVLSGRDYTVLEFATPLARAGIYSELPTYVAALNADDPSLSTGLQEVERGTLIQKTGTSYEARHASGPGVLWLAESSSPDWDASLAGMRLEQIEAGWGNAFELPADTDGRLSLAHDRSIADILWPAGAVLGWLFIVGAAFPRRIPSNRGPRRAT